MPWLDPENEKVLDDIAEAVNRVKDLGTMLKAQRDLCYTQAGGHTAKKLHADDAAARGNLKTCRKRLQQAVDRLEIALTQIKHEAAPE